MPENNIESKFFVSRFKIWLALISMIPASITGIIKGVEEFQHRVLGKAQSVNEIYMRHLIYDHIMKEDKSERNTMNTREGFAEICKFPSDDCIAVQRKTEYGDPISITVLPSPDKIDKIKEIYSSSCGVAYAQGIKFDFGVHLKDFKCKEIIVKDLVKRVYSDGCCLQYRYDVKSGSTIDWTWIIYKH